MSLVMLGQYDLDAGGYQLTEKHEWITAFGARYAVGVNGIGITLILLTTILTPIVILAAWGDREAQTGIQGEMMAAPGIRPISLPPLSRQSSPPGRRYCPR